MKATDSQIEAAIMHATVWGNVFDICHENSLRQDINQELLSTLATFSHIISGEYRRVANSKKVDE